MKFSFLTLFLGAAWLSEAAEVAVHPAFLSEDEITQFRSGANPSAIATLKNITIGRRTTEPTVIEKYLHSRIRSALKETDTCETEEEVANAVQTFISTLVKTSVPHKDRYASKKITDHYGRSVYGHTVRDKVGFVFLDDNSEEAVFVHGDTQVPAKAGTLVTFDGNADHHTIVPKDGIVRILGPFAVVGKQLSFVSVFVDAGECSFEYIGDGECQDSSNQLFDICIYNHTIGAESPITDACKNDFECIGYSNKGDDQTVLHYSDGHLGSNACPGAPVDAVSDRSGVGCPVNSNGSSSSQCFMKTGCPTPFTTDPTNATVTCGGDPHFATWSNGRFNYHGECDLVLVSSKTFGKGKGLDIHVRTKLESFYSIIAGVGVKVGPEVFEFNHEEVGSPKYFANGKQLADLPYEDDQFKVTSHNIHNEDHNRLVQIIDIGLGGGQASLQITVMDQWVHLSVKASNFMDSKGITGSFPDGKMLARDGVTNLSHDRNAYGSQWQVQEDEPKLFHSVPEGHPQAPNTCNMPLEDAHKYLRTRNMELYNMAEQACKQEGITGLELEDCIFDVSVMNNPKIAAAWWASEKAIE